MEICLADPISSSSTSMICTTVPSAGERKNQNMLDKENIRQWLIERGFSGEGTPPVLTDEIRVTLAERYIELYTQLTGNEFHPLLGDVKARIERNLEKAGIYA